ncbi:MAG: DUF1934 domain-containing protein [Oscillospiraceae bacterium]|nr:DUF1934 domain-containing protein [Oscillospiraceae bacterium]
MKTSVLVTVRGMQDYEDADADSVELTTAGTLYEKGTAYYLLYEETDESGLGKTKTTVKFEPDRVSVSRSGETTSHLIFEEGKKHISYYDMGFGSLCVGVNTHSLTKNIGPNGGTAEIRYSMEINNALAGENQLFITVRPTQ